MGTALKRVGVPLMVALLGIGWVAAEATGVGATASPPELISVSTTGLGGNGNSGSGFPGSDLSADGNVVVFASQATDLVVGGLAVPSGTNLLYARDRAAHTTTLVSVDDSGAPITSGSYWPKVSADGRYVVFQTDAALPGDTNARGDVYMRDLVDHTTTRVSVADDGSQLPGNSANPDISADGRYVAFVYVDPSTGQAVALVRDRVASTTTQVDVNTGGSPPNASFRGLSPNGRFLTFFSYTFDGGSFQVFVHVRDRVLGQTWLASVDEAGQPLTNANSPFSVSDTGATVFPDGADVRVFDPATGTSTVIGQGDPGAVISGDGRYVAYQSTAPNGVANDTDASSDVFRYDRSTGTTELVSIGLDNAAATNYGVGISDSGGSVGFESTSVGLLPAGSGFGNNVFVTDVVATPADATPPTITVASPTPAASYSLGQVVVANYSCDDGAGSGVATCDGTVSNGALLDTSTAGPHTFVVTATDNRGNPNLVSMTYQVLAGNVSTVATGGAIVTTDPGGLGATPDVPVQTQIVVPADGGGTISVAPQAGTPPAGFALFGQVLQLDGPAANGPARPYVVTFSIDASVLNGIAPADIQVLRNGTLVGPCTDPSAAVPDPCVAATGFVANGGGDAYITVRTTHFSLWSVARLAYTRTGFFAPVDNLPTLNTVKAGSAVPIKFGLGGNRGLNVFAAGSPSSAAVACGAGPTDPVEQVAAAGASTLTYDAGSARYQYVWKTDKAWTGCRDLVLRFRDGSFMRARFSFK